MKRLLQFTIILFCINFVACNSPDPPYGLSTLEGRWQRVLSSDSRSDSLIIIVVGDGATIDFVPMESHFVIGQKKWTNLLPVADEGHFQLYDLSKDGNYWKAVITMINNNSFQLRNKDFPNAPGSSQKWIKL